MHKRHFYSILFFLTLLLISCSSEKRKVVAVSQCSMDEWRDQMNAEMRREAFCHSDLDVEYYSYADNSEEQIQDIESFIARHVDLIVVAPNEEEPLRPVIEKAYDAGIPVVLIDRKADTEKYTAYVGGDNEEVGRLAANYILDKLPHGGRVLEIQGLASSSSSQERARGFHQIIDKHPEIKIVDCVAADWKRAMASDIVSGLPLQPEDIDVVFAYNDRMAIGAHDALQKKATKDGKMPLFIGVDALMNDTVGVGMIENGTLDASFLYPTGGDKAIHTAACILNGKQYERNQIMQTSLVTGANVHLMRLQAEHITEQNGKIEFLNDRLNEFFREYSAQQTLLYTLVIVTLIIVSLLLAVARGYVVKHRLNIELSSQKATLAQQKEELVMQKEMLEQQRDALESERDKLMELQNSSNGSDDVQSQEQSATQDESDPFLLHFQEVLQKNLSNSDLTVDMLGAEMRLGRVQLYRRIKALTGLSPNEMLRTARLNTAYILLKKKELTVSEVAYSVGFSSPSYFAKCYKEQFGVSPSA